MIRALLISLALMLGLSFLVAPAYADTKTIVCDSLRKADGDVQCESDSSDTLFTETVDKVMTVLSFIIGAVAVIMIIIGGFRYVVSGGDSAGVEGAKNTILYAVIGLVIAIIARPIVVFVISWFQ